ncbi:MAG: TetR/AcrR family transcriptional regulator [Tenericutes bacterium]|nr:TetR/AcrR family transcriptional regulator [Mycoplasmatota bacterium]
MKKQDLRIMKTKKALYQSLIQLMKEKTFEEIRVSDICELALINRSTFYAHFDDKYELLYDYIKDLKNDLKTELSKNKEISNTKEYYIEMIKIL